MLGEVATALTVRTCLVKWLQTALTVCTCLMKWLQTALTELYVHAW